MVPGALWLAILLRVTDPRSGAATAAFIYSPGNIQNAHSKDALTPIFSLF
jgi:hypothetical protein